MIMFGYKVVNKKVTDTVEQFSLTEDGLFIDIFSPKSNYRVPLYHTTKGQYLGNFLTLEQCSKAYEPYGYISLDTVNVINLKKINKVTEKYFKLEAHFENGEFTSISTPNRMYIEHLIVRD